MASRNISLYDYDKTSLANTRSEESEGIYNDYPSCYSIHYIGLSMWLVYNKYFMKYSLEKATKEVEDR